MNKITLTGIALACFAAGGVLLFLKPPSTPAVMFEKSVENKSSAFGPYAVTILPAKEFAKESVHFANGEVVKDWGYSVRYLGALWNSNGKAAVAISSQDCVECEPSTSVAIYSAAWKTQREVVDPGRFGVMDEKVKPPKEVVEVISRLFIGNCLRDFPAVFVSTLHRFTDDKGFEGSAITLEEDGRLHRHELKENALTEIGERVKSKDCLEYEGRDSFVNSDGFEN